MDVNREKLLDAVRRSDYQAFAQELGGLHPSDVKTWVDQGFPATGIGTQLIDNLGQDFYEQIKTNWGQPQS